MADHRFLAFDIGATSGRSVLSCLEGGRLSVREIKRFPNRMIRLQNKFYWDIYALYAEILDSLKICVREGIHPDSLGIDTWGVDFGFIMADGSLAGLPRSYRDPFTAGMPEEFFRKMSREEVYGRTGIQIMDFNTLYQLYAMKKEGSSALGCASGMLFIPDLLSYMLTGRQVCEYTVASTSQMLDPVTRTFDLDLASLAGMPGAGSAAVPVVMPGTVIGELSDSVCAETGAGRIPVVAVAGHDTASAVAAVPASDEKFAYLSSGTWSLMGVETDSPVLTDEAFRNNFTNEGGVEGTVRFLRNITGMWLLEQCRKEWAAEGGEYDYGSIVAMAGEKAPECPAINPDDPSLANPESMTGAISALCERQGGPVPADDSAFVRCIFKSLSQRYRDVLEMLTDMSPVSVQRLHIIGGGARNALLNQWTADAIGMPVIAGPAEATAIGNCMVQAQAAGLVKDRWEYRRLIAGTFPPEVFLPGTK